MTKKINLDLFVRLMRDPAPTRKDLLEYIGSAPVATDEFLRQVTNDALLAYGNAAEIAKTKTMGRIQPN